MKKLIHILLIIGIAFTLTSCHQNAPGSSSVSESSAVSYTAIENFTFEEADDGITITRYIGSDKHVVIPETIHDKPVTYIGSRAFLENKELLSVVLPNTVISIGAQAFYFCESLTAVTLPAGLEEIGSSAFESCQKLEDIVLPTSLKNLYGRAFFNCKALKQVTISKNCVMRFEAFMDSGLENVVFEDGVTYIPSTCFAGTNIQTLDLPKTVQTIEWQAFANCKNLKTVSLNEGLITIGDLAFYSTNLKEIVIPSTVTEIKESTFSNCSNLDKIQFEGDAPDNFLRMLQDIHLEPENVHYTIYYHKNAAGFTSPEWNGYPTEIW